MQHDYIKSLVDSARNGRKNAFRELCDINLKKIYNLCVRMLVDTSIAEIVVTEIFVDAWKNIKFVRDDIPFDLWLRSIAVYTILDEIRTKKRAIKLGEETGEDIVNRKTEIDSKSLFEIMVMTLPEKERVSFILHDIEGYAYQDVADFMTELPMDEIKSIVRSTRIKLIEAGSNEL
ncbi:MAG: RNA polymerase sigma factor [Melioribacteraceae bacterium]|nr:RNA polymerase sigma factor [Melioribacteraceae bacterium]